MISDQLTGVVMLAAGRHVVDWLSDEIDAEASLAFSSSSRPATLRLAKVDPDADFSYDFEDLSFTRTGECPP